MSASPAFTHILLSLDSNMSSIVHLSFSFLWDLSFLIETLQIIVIQKET